MLNRTCFVTTLFLVSAGNLSAFTVPERYYLKTDSLFGCSDYKSKTFVGIFKDDENRVLYYASTSKLLDYAIDTVQYHLADVCRYPEYFDFIKRSELIAGYTGNSGTSAFFNVAAAAFAKALFIGSLDSVVARKDGCRKICYNKVHNIELNKKYFEKEKGGLKFDFHEFTMYFTLKKIDAAATNVCLVSIVAPNMWIPNWLFKMTAYFLFPKILSDFEDALRKEYSPRH